MTVAIPPDPRPDLPIERGKEGTGVGDWVPQQKYPYLRKYLELAQYPMRSPKWRHRIYIDPFCATGRVQVKGENFTRPGGAAEAWHALEGTPAAWTRMLVGDIDPIRAEACSERLKALGANATKFSGPAKDTVREMVEAVPPSSLCIVFVDPYNLALLDFEMLKTLARLPNVDLIVHFSTMDLWRNTDAELEPSRARFDTTAPGWRGQPWATTSNKHNLTVHVERYWRELVARLGFTCSQACPLVTNDRQAGIYKLVFFARHKLPLKLWDAIARPHNREFPF